MYGQRHLLAEQAPYHVSGAALIGEIGQEARVYLQQMVTVKHIKDQEHTKTQARPQG